ncbi:MAG: asparagine--tRNA ligase [Spirochaetaceae bacterium]|jgi:asparaginyl-tRNA synthetase|nr:asparagine--tRNA ligase [Spirochaetaceae bacterium]
MKRIKELLQTEERDIEIELKGWIRTKRDSKDLIFLEINDGSTLKGLQIILDKKLISEEIQHDLGTGASVSVSGILVDSPAKGQSVELQGKSLILLGNAPAMDYPLQKKKHSFEFLREIAHLRPRTNTFGALARVRNALSFAIHQFFQQRGFLYIHTPIITGSDAEGAGQMFQVTTLDINAPARDSNGKVNYNEDFFGKKAHLTVSGQLQAENYACALGNVYTFGPTFRAENSKTTRHLAEFWMVEPEMAFCDLDGDQDMADDFINYLLNYILKHCPEDLEFFNQWILKGTMENLQSVAETPFERISYTQAMKALEKAPFDFQFKPHWGCDLQTEHERYLTEQWIKGPVIVSDYPREIKAFYMKQNEDGKTVRAMDVLVPRLGEIIGGSQREEDLDKLKLRMNQMDLDTQEYNWYLDLRRYGTVPHAGFGLGFERLIQYVTGLQNIRDVIPFPRAVGTIKF